MRSVKVAYSKNGFFYLRTGKDGFKTGNKVKNMDSLINTWGYRRLEDPVKLRDSEELVEALKQRRFSIGEDGDATYK